MPVKKTKKPAKPAKTIKAAKKAPARAKAPAPVKRPSGKGTPPVAKATPAKPAPPVQPPENRAQYAAFERAIQLFHKRQFREAKEWFQKATVGPAKEVKANAELHIRMCERRLAAPPPTPKSLEEMYTYAIALINSRNLAEARKHLEAALKIDARADHVYYALAVCLGLSGDVPGAYDNLRRAIELQPRNRAVARQDSDLEEVSRQPLVSRLLYPERSL